MREDQTPPASDFQPDETHTGQFSGSISKPFSGGSTLSANIDFNRTKQNFSSPFASQLATINPAYRSNASLSYRLPLMRGAGGPDYNDALNASMAETEASRLQREVVMRDLSLQATNIYFRLLSDGVSVELADVAMKRAHRLLNYQEFREQFGLIETADRRQTEALLAARKLEYQQAIAQQTGDMTSLNRLMLRAPDAPVTVDVDEHSVSDTVGGFEASVAMALERRPEFLILQARLDAAESRVAIARNDKKMKLDVVAEFGTLGLDDDASGAANDVFSTADRFAGLSLELGDTLGRTASNADLQQAVLSRERILAQRNQTIERVEDELADVLSTLTTGEQTLKLARQLVEAEKQKFEAELQRYRDGRSDTATLVQFEGDLHTAELQAELQRLTLMLADKQYAWSTGELLDKLGVVMPAYKGMTP